MRIARISQMAMAIVLLIVLGVSYAQDDYKGCTDHPMFSRMQNFYISSCQEVEYDSHTFYDEKGEKQVIVGVLSIWEEVPLTVRNVRLVEDMKTYATRKNNTFGFGEKMGINIPGKIF